MANFTAAVFVGNSCNAFHTPICHQPNQSHHASIKAINNTTTLQFEYIAFIMWYGNGKRDTYNYLNVRENIRQHFWPQNFEKITVKVSVLIVW